MAIELNHVRRGSGKPLLLLHSLGGSIVMWEPVLDLLAAEREVIAVDLPGFGSSPSLPHETAPSAANLATAAIEFYDSLGLEGDPHTAGVSLGGWVAIEIARQRRASSVVGLCTAGFWPRPLGPRSTLLDRLRKAGRVLSPLLTLMLATEGGRRRSLGGTIHHPERVSHRQALELARNYLRAPAYPAANALMRGGVVGPLDDVEVPLTLAWAEFDRLVRPPRPGALPASVHQVLLPDCGHVPTWDAPELVSRVILEGSGHGLAEGSLASAHEQ